MIPEATAATFLHSVTHRQLFLPTQAAGTKLVRMKERIASRHEWQCCWQVWQPGTWIILGFFARRGDNKHLFLFSVACAFVKSGLWQAWDVFGGFHDSGLFNPWKSAFIMDVLSVPLREGPNWKSWVPILLSGAGGVRLSDSCKQRHSHFRQVP